MRRLQLPESGYLPVLLMLALAVLVGLLMGIQRAHAVEPGECRTRNVILVTLDGLRWQEVFAGIDATLLRDPEAIRFAKTFPDFEATYWRESAAARRAALLPFIWSEIAERGQLHGDRTRGSRVGLANALHFSYPGYNEILTGVADPRIASNEKLPNPNRTVLEWLAAQPEFEARVAAFGSWDVFPYIVNEARAGVPVNAGFEALDLPGHPNVALLNELQAEIPSPWDTVRLDAFTHRFAMAWLAAHRPRLLYVALGETDDFAHDGWYDLYARAATRSDTFISELWAWAQSDPEYRDRTTLIVTTDHGRGRTRSDWRHHGLVTEANPQGIPGDDEIWFAIIGPDTPALGAVADGPAFTAASVPATVAQALGLTYQDDHPELQAPGPVPGALRCGAPADR